LMKKGTVGEKKFLAVPKKVLLYRNLDIALPRAKESVQFCTLFKFAGVLALPTKTRFCALPDSK
jgi:hypothetical protein